MRVSSAESWMALRRKYFQLQVYASNFNSWVKFMIVPSIFSISSTIVVAIYATVKLTDVPILIHMGFAWIGFSFLIFLFWFGFELLVFIQSSEAIVATLASKDQYLLELERDERLYLIKFAKATRELGFNIGEFTNYSIDVLIAIWEELLNQILFLFSL